MREAGRNSTATMNIPDMMTAAKAVTTWAVLTIASSGPLRYIASSIGVYGPTDDTARVIFV